MTNNKSRGGGFMALLLPWPLVLQIPYLAIGRVKVDKIENES
jgi:hypothetical protein